MFCVMLVHGWRWAIYVLCYVSARVVVYVLCYRWRWAIYVLCYVECTGEGGLFMFCVMLSARVEVGYLCSVLC